MNKAPLVKKILEANIHKLASSFGLPCDLKIMDQLDQDRDYLAGVNQKIVSNSIFRKRCFESVYEFSVYRNLLFYLVRVLKPRVVVETGVLHGLTSAWILKALDLNQNGKLISVDLPRREWKKFFPDKVMGPGSEGEGEDQFPEGVDPGWIIPDFLRKRWELKLGPSQHHLEACLSTGDVGLFIHDSDHSYEIMKFECKLALKMAPQAVHVIDNFNMNSYFFEYLAEKTRNYRNPLVDYMLMDDVSDRLTVSESTALYRQRTVC